MHGHGLQKLTAIGLLILGLAWTAGCRPAEPCADRDCGFGTCADGLCICEAIYEGSQCDTLCSAKYVGEHWLNDVLCNPPGLALESVVRESGLADGRVHIYNVLQQGDSVMALARQDTLIVEQQIYGTGYVHGVGLYSPDTFTLEIDHETANGQITHCVAVFNR